MKRFAANLDIADMDEKQTIEIHTITDGQVKRIPVECEYRGALFAVHPTFRAYDYIELDEWDRFRVTHIPTGRACAKVPVKEAAIRVAKYLDERFGDDPVVATDDVAAIAPRLAVYKEWLLIVSETGRICEPFTMGDCE